MIDALRMYWHISKDKDVATLSCGLEECRWSQTTTIGEFRWHFATRSERGDRYAEGRMKGMVHDALLHVETHGGNELLVRMPDGELVRISIVDRPNLLPRSDETKIDQPPHGNVLRLRRMDAKP